MLSLREVKSNARLVARRDGYDQAIIKAHDDGSYSFSRKYEGCCPAWYGKIVEIVKAQWRI